MKTYKGLTDNDAFRNYPKMDMALFYYGYTLQGGKYMKEARAVYDKLLKNYPNSKYVPEAHLAFADYYFENNQLDDAEARYKHGPQVPQVERVLVRDVQDGLDPSQQAALPGGARDVLPGRAGDQERQEAGGPEPRVEEGLRPRLRRDRQGRQGVRRVQARRRRSTRSTCSQILADLYLEQGKSDKAIYTYRELMKRAPTNKNVCLWQYNVAHAMLSMVGANNADKVDEIENLVQLYGALKGKKVLPPAEAQECHDNAAAMSGELARAYHSESAKTKNPETLAYAEKLYKVYLEVFPDAEDYAQTQYFYAELLWSRAENEKNPRLQTELWENAARRVHRRRQDRQGRREADEGVGVRRRARLEERAQRRPARQAAGRRRGRRRTTTRSPSRKPIPEREQKMLAAFDIYINYIKDPKDDELVGMKFLKANIYRRYNHFDEAIPIFQDILEHHRSTRPPSTRRTCCSTSTTAAEVRRDARARRQARRRHRSSSRARTTSRRRSTRSRRSRCASSAEKLETRREGDQGLREVRRVRPGATSTSTTATRKTPDNDEVLYNAGVCFEDGKSIGAAIQRVQPAREVLPELARSPRRRSRGSARRTATSRSTTARRDKLEEYAKKYAGEKDAYDAMSDAVFYRKGIGDDDKAIDDTKYFIKTFGQKKPAGGRERGVLADLDLREAGRQATR